MKTIGLFDSGVGGLTCLKTLLEEFPGNRFVYLGDTARLPYGTKSQETIAHYTLQNIETLKKFDVDVIISACHSASSAILLREIKIDRPLFEVITPACELAAKRFDSIGIMATAATTKSEIYPSMIHEQRPGAQVEQQACPLLVGLVENGWIDDPITNLVIQRYLKPMLDAKVQGIVLACTHFPALSRPIKNVAGPSIELIDPAQPLAEKLRSLLAAQPAKATVVEAFLTDVSPHFKELAQKMLGGPFGLDLKIRQI